MAEYLNDIDDEEYFRSQYGDDMDAMDDFQNNSSNTTAAKKRPARRSLFADGSKDESSILTTLPDTMSTFGTTQASASLDFHNELNSELSILTQAVDKNISSGGRLKRQLDKDSESDISRDAKRSRKSISDEFSEATPNYIDDFNAMTPSEEAEMSRLKMMLDKKKMTGSQSSQGFASSQSSHNELSHQIHYVSDNTRVLTRAPVADDYVTVTDADGKRVYLKLSREAEFGSAGPDMVDCRKRSLHLLETSITQLRLEAEKQKREKILLKLSEAKTSYESMSRIDDDDDDVLAGLSDIDSGVESETESCKSILWVDKYTPKSYIDLLSEESTNRSLLHWLKLWDHVVFGKEKPKIKHLTSQPVPGANPGKDFGNKGGQFAFKTFPAKTPAGHTVNDEIPEFDDNGCPVQRVALLCGPPGLGKTTLAHVIAKHCGYNVVEMNASDDRSPEIFKNKIEAATQMTSVLDKEQRPNCLIIDEIDGAPSPSINLLLSIIKGQPLGKTKGKQKKVIHIRRPVICICNDLYALSLRQLRQSSLVLHFNTTSSRLALRLAEIMQREKIHAENTAVTALCEKTDYDIRSCLNTLQFVKSEGKSLTLSIVRSSCVGQKDQQKGLFTVWQEIFMLPKQSKKSWADTNQLDGSQESNKNTLTSRYYNILNLSTTVGEYDKVIQGLYENFLEVKFKDTYMEAIGLGLEWIGFGDQIQQQIYHNQSFTLMKYLPYIPVIFHMLYASTTKPYLHYPTGRTECNLKSKRHISLLSSMIIGMPPTIRHQVNYNVLTLDFIPLLLVILKPTLRPVNTQLYTLKEKQQLSTLIAVMVTFNLTYQQERNMEGQYVYNLEPNIESLVMFPGLVLPKQLTYASKQFLAREIELLKLTKHETSLKTSKKTKEPAEKNVTKRHEQKLVAKSITEESCKPTLDFFGRTIQANPAGVNSGSADRKEGPSSEEHKSGLLVHVSQIWFKFNKGYSNAIRRKVKIEELL